MTIQRDRRPHQSLGQATPRTAWELIAHTPATESIPLEVLEAKASQYRQARRLRHLDLQRSAVTISKAGKSLSDESEHVVEQAADQSIIEVTAANRQVYYQGYHVSLPTTFAGREFYRTITDEEFLLSDITTGEVVLSFPLPMKALQVRGRYVSSYAIQGVEVTIPTKNWERQHAQYRAQFAQRRDQVPEVFNAG